MGFQPLWTHLGRRVVGNLTTVTTSLRNFTTLLLGLYFTERALVAGHFDEGERANLFLKFEQLAAYSRYAYNGDETETAESPRGLRRVQRKLAEGEGRVRISAAGEHQILSSQKTYGIWGLFTVAARQSGLVERQENRLTPKAQDFVEREYLPHLSYAGSKGGGEALRFLDRDSAFEPKGKDKRLGKALAELLGAGVSVNERAFYTNTLVLGAEENYDHTRGRQRQLWDDIAEINDAGRFDWDADFGSEELNEVVKRAGSKGQAELAEALGAIQTIEPVLATAGAIFGFMLARGDSTVDAVARDISDAWGKRPTHIDAGRVEALGPRLQGAFPAESAERAVNSSGRVVRMARLIAEGDYAGFARVAVEQNADVMRARGGAPWVTLDGDRLKVRLREQSGRLPAPKRLPTLWANTYFINSLKSVGRAATGRGD